MVELTYRVFVLILIQVARERSRKPTARSIAQQLLQPRSGGVFSLIGALAGPHAFGHVEVLAKVGHVLLLDEVGAAFPALFSHCPVVMDAIETDLQIRPALGAGLEPAGASGQLVFATAVMAMTSHEKRLNDE